MFSCLEKLENFISFKRCESGLAAIEFAIVIPVFILLLIGIVNFGYVMYLHHNMQDVAGNTLRSVMYGQIEPSIAIDKANQELQKLHGSFEVDFEEEPSNNDITITIVADAKSSTLMPFPLVSIDFLMDEFSVSVTSQRISQFNPAKI